mgnify:CR=1 FL=1
MSHIVGGVNIFGNLLPVLFCRMLCKCFKERRGRKKIETDDDKYTSWERDYDLVDFPIHGLYEEYLEMGKLITRHPNTAGLKMVLYRTFGTNQRHTNPLMTVFYIGK